MLEKKYMKTKDEAEITFTAPANLQAETVYLVGDFNDWDEKATPMKRQKDGTFTVKLKLQKGREYQFRYMVNENEYHNDWAADKYMPNPFGGDNSVVVVEA